MSTTVVNKPLTGYWLRVFAWYALAEAVVQLIFFFILNTFGSSRISNLEYHLVMWLFQCLLIWPIWWVAWLVRKQKIIVQVVVNLSFFFIYGYCWFGPIQDVIAYVYNNFLDFTQPGNTQDGSTQDSGMAFPFINYQILKHAFRLSWFYLANYFYNYHLEEKKKIELAVSNKELQLKLLKWHLNPSFYFKTIRHLQQSAAVQPSDATEPILQLAKVMEYVIYEAREPQIEMKKEIQFLSNYVQLINQQPDNKTFISLECNSGYEQLKIAPLLLAGLVDSIVSTGTVAGNSRCGIIIKFSGNEMHFSVAGGAAIRPTAPPLLDELYRGRFTSDYSPESGFNLRIQLDAI
jgi:hypothetical protein